MQLQPSTAIHHPSSVLSSQIVEHLRKQTIEQEVKKSLTPSVLSLIYQHQWFKLLIPKMYGGLELPLPKVIELFEAIAWADGNTGWCVNLGAGANMFAGYIQPDMAETIFSADNVCCAGSGAISGTAIETNGGYLLSGKWKYASGANHATHFTANGWLLDNNGNSITENEVPQFLSFIIPADMVTNHRNWQAIGLRATSSNDFEVNNVFVPYSCTFNLTQPSKSINGPLYQFPFSLMAVTNMCCMTTGLAQHFIDAFISFADEKTPLHSSNKLSQNSKVSTILKNAQQQLNLVRQNMYDSLSKRWQQYESGLSATASEIEQTSTAFKTAAHKALGIIDELYPYCGMSILDEQNELNKIWRDAHVASLHYLLTF